MSWRDDVEPQTQSDLDGLVDAGFQLAEETLRDGRPLHPFALALSESGDVEVWVADDVTGPSSAIVDDLWSMLRERAGDLTGAAVAYDVRIDSEDAVQVAVEHRDPVAPALVLALPYSGAGASLRTGTPRAAAGSRRLWG